MLMDMLDGWEMVVLAFGIPAVVGMVVTLRRSSQLAFGKGIARNLLCFIFGTRPLLLFLTTFSIYIVIAVSLSISDS